MTKGTNRQDVINRLIELLRQERLRQQRSMNDVAAQSGLNYTMIGRVERGERMPTIDTLLRIAEALDIDLSDFLAQALRQK